MTMFKLKPVCKNYLWGGNKLAERFNIESDEKIIAEAWILSCHNDGMSEILTGDFKGKTFAEFLKEKNFEDIPILIKLLDVKDKLSIQVHPNDEYALKHENQFGKDEFWYILDAEPDAFIYYGFKKEISKEEFLKRIEENTLPEVLNKIHVKKGDSFFIPAGTVHSAGQGVVIAEIQKSSNVTYRIYDYDRIGADGKKRELHIEKALEVLNFKPTENKISYPHLAECDYFTVDKLNLNTSTMQDLHGFVDWENFLHILILEGDGVIQCDDYLRFYTGDSIFISAGTNNWRISGKCDALVTTVYRKNLG